MFDTARLRLTAWYMAILAAIVALLSAGVYELLRVIQNAELNTLAHSRAGHTLSTVFARDAVTLAYQIVGIDLALLLLAAGGAYFLAGRTLEPIKDVMERQRRFTAGASHELRTP